MKKNKDKNIVYYFGGHSLNAKENAMLIMSAKYYASHLEELKRDIQRPDLGYNTYGKLGALNKRAAFIINELIEKIEYQDKIIRELYEKSNK